MQEPTVDLIWMTPKRGHMQFEMCKGSFLVTDNLIVGASNGLVHNDLGDRVAVSRCIVSRLCLSLDCVAEFDCCFSRWIICVLRNVNRVQ